MRKGQSSIVVFPVLVLILVAIWLLSTSSFFNLTTGTHNAFIDMSERHKSMMDASLLHEELPNPLSNTGEVQNDGLVVLTDLKAYHLAENVTESDVVDMLFQKGTTAYAISQPRYGDVLVIRSKESFWGITLVPSVRLADAARKIGVFSGTNQAIITSYTNSPTSVYYPTSTLNQEFEDAIEAQDETTYTISKNNDVEFRWDSGSSCFSIGTQLAIFADNGASASADVDVKTWNGNSFSTVYTCVFPVGNSSCYTPDLSSSLVQDGTAFKIRVESDQNNFEFDYVMLNARCAA
ncbi:MAG: hypothetical protein JW834_01415 [Candidatus Diapherotrites archaeon]|nr:hypothetical protein [Candidatus Diapherotrites archaeon]